MRLLSPPQFNMQRATLWLFLFIIPHWGATQTQTKLGCPLGCICQDLSATNPQYKVECQALPDSPLPTRTSEFKSRVCPSNLTTEIFNRLKPSFVDKLDLSGAKIVNIADTALGVFNKVIIIDLSHNEIQNIGSGMLAGCNRLEELRLSNNRISQLGHNCFKGLFRLKTVYLDHNMIPSFPEFTPTLENLDISYNEIKSIRNKKMIALQSLNVCGNTINDVAGLLFMRLHTICMPRFLEMDFTQLPIENLRLDSFPGHEPVLDLNGLKQMPNLMNFTIDGYQVSSFIWPKGVGQKIIHLALNHVSLSKNAEKEFLDNLQPTSVQSLDLSNSPQPAGILLKDSAVWDGLRDLEFIDLRSNNLTSLGELKAKANQISIDVSENPLQCDCTLANILKSGKNIQLVGNEALCASPEEFKNHPLATTLPDLCQEEPQRAGNELPSKGRRPVKPKDFDQESNLAPEDPIPQEIPHEEEPTVPSEPPEQLTPESDVVTIPEPTEDSTTESDVVTIPEPEITEEFASELTEKHTKPPPVDEDESAAFGHDEPKTSQTTYIIVGVVLALAFIGAIIFSVLFFYFRRRGHAGIENGNAQYRKHTSSRDNLVKGAKK